jgi:phytoene synthase
MIRPIYERTSLHRSVIEEVGDAELKDAYATCRSITRRHAKTFYMATRFLPNEKQRGIFAIYALCRYIDDMVDEAEDLLREKEIALDDIRQHLDDWKRKLKRTYEGKTHDDAILIAFSDVLRRYNIPMALPFELLEGVCMDLYKDRYNNFDELYDYSYKVASVVGLMTSEVFGYDDPEALNYAVDLGIAMQLTNILRDVGEDLGKGRIYLPKDDLETFGVTESNLFDHQLNDNFIQLMQFQINRARDYYSRAQKGITMLSEDSRLPVYLAHFNYSGILGKIEKRDFNVFTHRAYLSSIEKFSILPRLVYRTKISST